MSFDAGSVIGHIKLDSSDFVKGAQNVNKHTDSMAKSMFNAQFAYDLFKQAGMTVINTLKNVAIAGFNSAVEMENYSNSFTTLLGSAEKADKVLSDFKKKAAATPFSMKDFASGGKLLLSFGQSAESLMPTMSMLGDIAQGNKEKFSQLNLVYAQIMSTGKLMGQDLLQLISAGFNPLTIMAEQTGKSVAQLKDEMSKGAISAEMVTKAFQAATSKGGLFFGGMESASKTFSGRLSTLLDDFESLERIFGEMALPFAKDIIAQLDNMALAATEFVQSADGFKIISDVISTLGGYLVAAGTGIKIFVEEITTMGQSTFKSVSESLKSFGTSGKDLNPIFLGVAAIMEIVFLKMQLIVAGIKIAGAVVGGVKDAIDMMSGDAKKKIDNLRAEQEKADDADWARLQKKEITQKQYDKAQSERVEQLHKLIEYYNTADQRYIDGVVGSVAELVSKVGSSGTDIERIMNEMNEAFSKGSGDIRKSLQGVQTELDNTSTATKTVGERFKAWYAQFKKPEIDKDNTIVGKFKEWADAHGITMEKIKEQNNTTMIHLKEKWEAVSGDIFNALQNLYQNISGALAQSLEDDQTLEDNDYKRKKAQIEASVTDEAEKKKQLEALEKDHAAKTAEIKKKQFETQKVASIISAIIATAVGVANALSMAQLFPFNFVLAGIIAAAGAVQIGTIASQPTPEFAAGTGMGTYQGLALVGERGPELVNFGQPAQIFPADQTSGMLGGGIRQENNFYGDINSEIDLDRASAQQARKLRTLLRAS